jgi:hypothetical protein
MNPLRRIAPLLALGLAACAAAPDIDGRLAELRGRPVQPALNALGRPTKQWSKDDKTFYAWVATSTAASHRDCEDHSHGPTGSTTCGMMQSSTQGSYCAVHITADARGTIVEAFRDGPPVACGRFARRLER